MIKINLLSPADKLNIKWEKINHSIMSDFAIIIFIQVFFIFILLFAAGYLNMENKKLDKQLDSIQLRSEAKEINSIKTETTKYNGQLDSVLKIQEEQLQWTKILENFSILIPEGIRIDNINIEPEIEEVLLKNKTKNTLTQNNTKNFKVVIVGISKTMEDLLNFENNLKNSEIFINFNIEPKNYDSANFRHVLSIKRENIVSN